MATDHKPEEGDRAARLVCDRIREHLADYLERQERGLPADAIDRDVAAHLATCADCRELLNEITLVAAASVDAEIAPVPAGATPDLSFLRPIQAQRAQTGDDVGRIVITFSAELLASMRPPQSERAVRGQPRYHYDNECESDRDLAVSIDIHDDEQADDRAQIIVQVRPARRVAFDQAGAHIHLSAGDFAAEAATNELGRAVFAGVPRARLIGMQVEIILHSTK